MREVSETGDESIFTRRVGLPSFYKFKELKFYR